MVIDRVISIPCGRFQFEDSEFNVYEIDSCDLFEYLFMEHIVQSVEHYEYELENQDEYDLYMWLNSIYKDACKQMLEFPSIDSPIRLVGINGNAAKSHIGNIQPPEEALWSEEEDQEGNQTHSPIWERDALITVDTQGDMKQLHKEIHQVNLTAENLLEETQKLEKLVGEFLNLSSFMLDSHPTIENLLRKHKITRRVKGDYLRKKTNCSEIWLRANLDEKKIKSLMISGSLNIKPKSGYYSKVFTLYRERIYD